MLREFYREWYKPNKMLGNTKNIFKYYLDVKRRGRILFGRRVSLDEIMHVSEYDQRRLEYRFWR